MLYEEIHYNSRQQGRQNCTLPRSDNFSTEKDEWKRKRSNDTADIKSDFDIAEFFARNIGNRFDKRLIRIHYNIGNDRKRNTETENNYSANYKNEPNGIRIDGNKWNAPHSEICEPTEKEWQRQLQELNRLEFFWAKQPVRVLGSSSRLSANYREKAR